MADTPSRSFSGDSIRCFTALVLLSFPFVALTFFFGMFGLMNLSFLSPVPAVGMGFIVKYLLAGFMPGSATLTVIVFCLTLSLAMILAATAVHRHLPAARQSVLSAALTGAVSGATACAALTLLAKDHDFLSIALLSNIAVFALALAAGRYARL